MLDEAIVPVEWMLPESGTTPDPSSIYDVQILLATDGAAGPFDFCVTGLTPILSGGM